MDNGYELFVKGMIFLEEVQWWFGYENNILFVIFGTPSWVIIKMYKVKQQSKVD